MKKFLISLVVLAGAFFGMGPLSSSSPSGNGTGTVTHTGSLTANAVMVGNGTADSKVTGVSIDASNNMTGVAALTATTVNVTNFGTGFGTGVGTALGINTGSAGAFQVNNTSGASLTSLTAANISAGALANGMTGTTQSAGDNSTKLATTAYADAGSKAASVSTYASPDTTGGAVTLTNAVTEVWTNTTTTYALPAVASSAGKAVIFYVVGTNVVTIDPNASEIIVRDGTPQTGGVTMTLTGAAGNYVCMVCEGGRWITLGYKGTLAAGS